MTWMNCAFFLFFFSLQCRFLSRFLNIQHCWCYYLVQGSRELLGFLKFKLLLLMTFAMILSRLQAFWVRDSSNLELHFSKDNIKSSESLFQFLEHES